LTPTGWRLANDRLFSGVFLLAAAAWFGSSLLSFSSMGTILCIGQPGIHIGSHLQFQMLIFEPAIWALHWILMVTAMMLPFALPGAKYVRQQNFAGRQRRSVVLFFIGYAVCWVGFAILATAFIVFARAVLDSLGLIGFAGLIGCLLAAMWQISPYKYRALNRCHRLDALGAQGWQADHDAARFGWMFALRCAGSCAGLMVFPMIGSHGLLTMFVVMALLIYERGRDRPDHRVGAVLLTLLGIATLF